MKRRVGYAANLWLRAQTIGGQEARARDAESPVDSLFADIVRHSTKTEIAFLPGVGYGVAIPRGPITEKQLRNLLPHDSAIWTMRLSRRADSLGVEQSLENFLADDATRKVGGMIQVSGLRFSYDPRLERGHRVRDIRVGNVPLKPQQIYKVATNALLAQGGHKYDAFTRGTQRRKVGQQYEMVRSWLSRRGRVSTPPIGRIRKLAEKPKS